MLKKNALRRIFTASLALIIVSILYFFPTDNKMAKISKEINYVNPHISYLYLVNKDNYLARVTMAIKEVKSEIDEAQEIIDALRIGSDKKEYIPKNFKPIIPQNTKIIDISLDKGLLKINFSKELLDVNKNEEIKVIESLIYSLTEINNIKEIMLFIEGEKLILLPQSKIVLPNTLTRDFGINKIYDLDNLKNITKTTIYFIGKEDNYTYYVPVTKIDNNKKSKVEIIINELKSSPIYETNLLSYLNASIELLNYEILEKQIYLTFNNKILNNFDTNDILEEVKYSIALSLKDSLNVDEVIFKVDDEVIATLKEE